MNRAMLFFPSLVLGLGVLLISGMREQHLMPPRQPMAGMPRVMQGVEGRDIVISEEEQAVAGMSDYLMRQFGPDSAMAFTVYVGYYDRQVQGKSIHSPKNCLPGAGWEILSSGKTSIPGASSGSSANRVVLANGPARALVLYWYQGRGRAESSEYVVKWDLMRDAALYGRTEESLVRIVVPLPRTENGPATVASTSALASADSLAFTVARQLYRDVETILPQSPRN